MWKIKHRTGGDSGNGYIQVGNTAETNQGRRDKEGKIKLMHGLNIWVMTRDGQ